MRRCGWRRRGAHALGTGLRKGASASPKMCARAHATRERPGASSRTGVGSASARGHVDPQIVKDAALRGRKEGGRDALTVLASDWTSRSATSLAAAWRRRSRQRPAPSDAPGERRRRAYTLPARNLAETSVEKLRELTSPVPKRACRAWPSPAARARSKASSTEHRRRLDAQDAHGIPLTADEAGRFCRPNGRRRASSISRSSARRRGPACGSATRAATTRALRYGHRGAGREQGQAGPIPAGGGPQDRAARGYGRLRRRA
jgi:hypothetical protein